MLRVSTYRTRTNIPNLPTIDNIIQRPHDLLARRLAIQAVNLQDINVGAQTLDTGVDSVEDVFARQADAVDPGAVVGARGGNGRLVALVVDAEVAFC